MLFRKWGCLVGPENRIFRKLISVDRKKMALTTEIILHFHFYFKVFLEKERERERARDRWWPSSSPVRRSLANPELQSAPISQAPVRRPRSREALRRSRSARCFARSWLMLHEIAPSIAISWRQSRSSRLREIAPSIAISRRRSQSRLREIAPSSPTTARSTARSSDWSSRSTAPSNLVERRSLMIFCLGFFWVLSVFCWDCLFLLLFQTPENIFRKFFWNATKHMKTFSFPENSISKKWNIFRKCFYTNQTQP